MDGWTHDVLDRRALTGWANLNDFQLGDPTPVDAREVIANPGWSLYGLDYARNLAVFVLLPAGTDLAQSPFAYATQHRLAQRVLTMPLQTLEAVADLVPPVGQVVLLFSIGRCGSTLLSHALNAVPGVWCLSEPDAFSTLIMQHYHSRSRVAFSDEQVIRLIRACTRLQFRPPAGRPASVFAMKFRSQALFQAGLYRRALPEASCLFLYRDALGWVDSIYGMMRLYGFGDRMAGAERGLAWSIFTAAADRGLLDAYGNADEKDVPVEWELGPAWACNMAEYTAQLRSGVPFLALRYNEFNRDRHQSLERLLRHCHLPAGAAEAALAAFDTDSQAGTHLARPKVIQRLGEKRLAAVAARLARWPSFGDPDLLLPDVTTSIPIGPP